MLHGNDPLRLHLWSYDGHTVTYAPFISPVTSPALDTPSQSACRRSMKQRPDCPRRPHDHKPMNPQASCVHASHTQPSLRISALNRPQASLRHAWVVGSTLITAWNLHAMKLSHPRLLNSAPVPGRSTVVPCLLVGTRTAASVLWTERCLVFNRSREAEQTCVHGPLLQKGRPVHMRATAGLVVIGRWGIALGRRLEVQVAKSPWS